MLDKKLTFAEALARDKMLYELVIYDMNKGMIREAQDDDELSERASLSAKIFNNIKKQIQNGEFTFEEVVDDIVSKNAAIARELPSVNLDNDKDVSKMLKNFDREIKTRSKRIKKVSFDNFQNHIESSSIEVKEVKNAKGDGEINGQ